MILTIKSKGEYTERNLGGLRTRIFKKLLVFSVIPLVIFLTLFLSILTDYKLHYFETETTSVTGDQCFHHFRWRQSNCLRRTRRLEKRTCYLISHEPKLDDKVQHKSLVKRLIGFAGDTIEVKDGRVTRNGDKFTYMRIYEQLQAGGVTIIPNEIWHFY